MVKGLWGWYNIYTMSDEERKLMISIAKAVEALSVSVKELQQEILEKKKVSVPEVAKESPVFSFGGMVRTPRAQISQVEKESGQDRFKMDIKFEGLESKQPGERMEISSQFIGEMEMLLRKYRISKLEGTYICQKL